MVIKTGRPCPSKSSLDSHLAHKSKPCRIFQDFAASTTLTDDESDYSNEYFREVLLSYRLLFGENRRSRRAFRSWLSRWQQEWKGTRDDPKLPPDPVLLILGSQGWESVEAGRIYDEIDAEDPTGQYSPISDFVFFGRRLLELQAYVRGHGSQSFKALWYNRQDVRWWWNFWVCRPYFNFE